MRSFARFAITLVQVHVGRGARTGLEDVDRELRVVLAGDDLVGRVADRARDLGGDCPGLLVGGRRGPT